ncbi:MAG: L,D-transpeptidase family protein [Candidatus Binataceae bacterium]
MHHNRSRLCWRIGGGCAAAVVLAMISLFAAPRLAHSWSESDFENRPLVAYPVPTGRDDLIGSLQTYTIRKGDTLLDVARWYGLSPTEVSNANNHMDWWAPPVGKLIIIPTEHILPSTPHAGIVLNIPEMRLYYYYPTPVGGRRRIGKAKFTHTAYAGVHKTHGKAKAHTSGAHPTVIYTFPVGLGRYDWRTPTGTWTIRDKTHNTTWVVPDDIYQEHLERDGEAEHVVEGGDPDNPLGHYRLALTLPMYAIHGTNVPWGVGMEVSHGCVRLYPEDIDRLYHRTSVGTPGRFVYQPIKYGWRGGSLYVEVHDDLYGVYPGLWRQALKLAKSQGLLADIETVKLEKAIEEKTGVPTYVMPGPEPPSAMPPTTETARSVPLPPAGSAASAPDADSSAGGSSETDTYTDSGTGKAVAAIPPPPTGNAIRPAPAPPADSAASRDSESNAGVSSADDENSASSASAAASDYYDTDDSSNGNAPRGTAATDIGDGSQWHRLPAGAMPVE